MRRGGVGKLGLYETIERLEDIRKKYGSLGVYLAVSQAVGFPETYPGNPFKFDKLLQVDRGTLVLIEGKKAYSIPKVFGTVDVSDTGVEVIKTAETRLSEDKRQIILVDPQHETDNYSERDVFENWGAGWTTLSDGSTLFVPENIGHRLSGRFNPYRNMLILKEDVLFSNPNAIEFSKFSVPIISISIYSDTPISDTTAFRFQRILQL